MNSVFTLVKDLDTCVLNLSWYKKKKKKTQVVLKCNSNSIGVDGFKGKAKVLHVISNKGKTYGVLISQAKISSHFKHTVLKS